MIVGLGAAGASIHRDLYKHIRQYVTDRVASVRVAAIHVSFILMIIAFVLLFIFSIVDLILVSNCIGARICISLYDRTRKYGSSQFQSTRIVEL